MFSPRAAQKWVGRKYRLSRWKEVNGSGKVLCNNQLPCRPLTPGVNFQLGSYQGGRCSTCGHHHETGSCHETWQREVHLESSKCNALEWNWLKWNWWEIWGRSTFTIWRPSVMSSCNGQCARQVALWAFVWPDAQGFIRTCHLDWGSGGLCQSQVYSVSQDWLQAFLLTAFFVHVEDTTNLWCQ